MKTLFEFATEKLILSLLVKERVKCGGKYQRRVKKWANEGKKFYQNSNPQSALDAELPKLDLLTSIFPSRNSWTRPHNHDKFKRPDGSHDMQKLNVKSLTATINRDRRIWTALSKLSQERTLFLGETAIMERLKYLERLDQYVQSIRAEIGGTGEMSFSKPLLKTLYKNEKKQADGRVVVTYRPLSIYVELRDKIILAIASRYLASMFNWYLHPNLLSYRSARNFLDVKHHVTDFNDGIKLIRRFRESHSDKAIFVADCDIKKFYDIVNHDVARDCFGRMLDAADLTDEGKKQVMRILNAYLHSYNFYDNVYLKSQTANFWKMVKSRRANRNNDEIYRFDWVGEDEFAQCYGDKQTFLRHRNQIGVPQGGSLSLMIADVLLNDVDKTALGDDLPKTVVAGEDSPRDSLFIRFCDDMVLMHTDADRCKTLINSYCQSLTDHKLIYHPFTSVETVKDGKSTKGDFWKVKSHERFCWREGEGNASAWVGFLGYEMRCDGSVRLRKSNVQKLIDKVDKRYYTMKRLMGKKKMSFEELSEKIEKSQNTLVKSLNFYTELQQDNPHFRRQLTHLDQRRKRALRYLACYSVRANCQIEGHTANELRAVFRAYLGEDHGFKKSWKELKNSGK